jgi:hypothetical protein
LDKTWQEYLADIANRTSSDYPVVVKVSDPLLIRFNEKSLVVNNTNFYTNIKSGLAFEGFYIYTSGLGIPIAEIGQAPKNKKDSRGNVVVDGQAAAELEKKAKKFLDVLEAKIATTENDNEIKKAIDRLCWQMHYDISKTDETVPPSGFYPDLPIDRGNTISDYFFNLNSEINGDTLIISADIADATSQLNRFNDYFTDSSDGYKEQCSTLNNNIVILCDRISNVSSEGGQEPDATLSYAMNKIAINLRADGNGSPSTQEYTISKALRDRSGDNELSVSGATKERTEVEEAEFHEISVNQLGQFGTTHNHRTLYDSVGSYAESSNNSTISAELNKIGNPGNHSNPNIDTLFGRLGDSDDGAAQTNTGTLFYEVLHRAGTRNLNTAQIEADSPFGKINADLSTTKTNTNYIRNDQLGSPSTQGTIWYDILHNVGTGAPGVTAASDSLMNKLGSVEDNVASVKGQWDSVFVPSGSGVTKDCIRAISSSGTWD